jgi:hypothetical protein
MWKWIVIGLASLLAGGIVYADYVVRHKKHLL